jgi:YVTN family beta-propeller protein
MLATAPIVLGASEKSVQKVITENDSGKCVVLKNEEIFYLKLRENPSTGYSWQLKLSPGLSVLSDNYTQDPAPEGYTGVPGTHTWEIKGVAPGSQQIKGIYRAPWENITGTEENLTLKINVVDQNTTCKNWDSENGTSNDSEVLNRTGEGAYAYITNEYENTVSVINTETNIIAATVHVGSNPVEIAVSPDGAKVYVANYYGNTVSVIETANNTVTATVNVGDNPNGIAVSPDGKKVYVTNLENLNMSVIDTATNTVIDTIDKIVSIPQGIAINQNGTKIYVPNTYIATFFAIDTTTKEITEIPVSGSCGVAVNPEGTKIYVTTEGDSPDFKGNVEVVDVANNTVTARVTGVGTNPSRVAVSPDGSKVYVTNKGSNNVSVIDASTNKVIATVNVGINPYGIAVTPDGKKVYVVNSHSNNVSVIDTALNEVTATLNVGNGPIEIAFGKSNVPSSETKNAVDVEPKSELTQSSNTSGKGNTKTPCFEIGHGIISLLAVFCINK